MKDEVFDLEFEHNGQKYSVTVKADLPVGPEPFGSDYEIYIDGRHKYTINHCKNEDDIHCWEIKRQPKHNHIPELVQSIGKAIDRYYLN